MNTSQPGPLLLLGGGAVMILASFLKAGEGLSMLSFDGFGLFGLLVLLFGAAIAAVGAIRAFAPQTSLPASVIGFSVDQVCFTLALTVFLWMFAQIGESPKIGVHLAWLGAAVAAAGAILGSRKAPAASSGSPTTSF